MHIGDFVMGVARSLDQLAAETPVATPRLTARIRRQLEVVVTDSDIHLALLAVFQNLVPQDDALTYFRKIDALSVRSVARLIADATSCACQSLPHRNTAVFLWYLPADPVLQAWVSQAFMFFLGAMLKTASAVDASRAKKRRIIVFPTVKQSADSAPPDSKLN